MFSKLNFSAVAGSLLIAASLASYNLMAEQRGPDGPPPEIQACKSLKSGDKCSFKTREGTTKSSTCISVTTPMGKELSCGEMPKPPNDKKGR